MSDKENLCQNCNKNKAEKPHICPFSQEIYGDDKTLCNCCDACQDRCAQEI